MPKVRVQRENRPRGTPPSSAASLDKNDVEHALQALQNRTPRTKAMRATTVALTYSDGTPRTPGIESPASPSSAI